MSPALRCGVASLVFFIIFAAGCTQPGTTSSTTVTTTTSNTSTPTTTRNAAAMPAPLLIAAREGKADMVRSLLSGNDTDVNVRDERGNTPLIEAARFGHDDTAKALLDRGANLQAKNNDGQTALALAVQNNHANVVRVLKEAGAKE